MSDTRRKHPGYFGVLMGLAIPWYQGLGLTFLLQGHMLRAAPSYRLVLHYVPPQVWGIVYLAVGVLLLVGATVKRIPHILVRRVIVFGWLLTLFYLITFIVNDIVNGIPPATLIPAFTTMLLIEYRAIVEPESNPAAVAPRRRRKWRR